MTRSRRNDSSILDDLFAFLLEAPAWIGPPMALAVFALCRWGLPWALSSSATDATAAKTMTPLLTQLAVQLSPFLGGGVLFVWILAELKKLGARRRLDRQSGIETIRELDWAEFEALLSEAFRRQGFVVDHAGRAGPDGGIDQRLQKAGATTLVQCKHWKQRQVGVKTVRELLGVVVSEGAQAGILVTSGSFTPDAVDFAATNPIRLIDGRELSQLIGDVQSTGRIRRSTDSPPAPAQLSPTETVAATPRCPKCSAEMVRRRAKTGQHAGSEFFGCSRYPACRGIRNLA